MRIAEHYAIHPSGAEITNLDTKDTPIDVASFKEANFYLDITATSGTGQTLDIDIVTYDETGDDWYIIASFAQQTTTGNAVEYCSSNLGKKIAADIAIDGTNPSFTFSLTCDLKD